MSVCALVLVKDEADIIEHTLRHLRGQVDRVIVSDNLSTDGTRAILERLAVESREAWLDVIQDDEVGYWQSRKTTELALLAFERGYQWVLPCDADEYWYAPDGRTVSAYLDGLAPDAQIVSAPLYNHIPTSNDPAESCEHCKAGKPVLENVTSQRSRTCFCEPNPFKRVGWRKREHGALPKVCCRARPDLVVHAGNHGASTSGTALTVPGLVVRHYSWRSEAQYVRKIRNGEAAYKATSLPEGIGAHWRMWAGQNDEAIGDHYRRWFHSDDPSADSSLLYDPAPGA